MFEKSQFRWNSSINLDFGRNFQKNHNFTGNLRKISIFADIFENSDFLVYISRNVVELVENSQFWGKVSKISIWVKNFENFRFWSKLFDNTNIDRISRKISNLVKQFEKSRLFWKNFHFGWHFRDISLWWKFSKNLEFCQNFRKSRLFSKNFGNVNLAEMFENLYFRRIARQISILVKTFKKCRFLPELSKIATLVHIFEKCRSDRSLLKHLDFDQNLKKKTILVEIFEKSRFAYKLKENFDFAKNNCGKKTYFW